MAYTINERVIAAFNALVGGVLDTDPAAQWYESINPFEFVSPKDRVWTQSDLVKQNPASTPVIASSIAAGALSGIIEDFTLVGKAIRMTPFPSVNNGWVALETYNDFTSNRLGNWVQPSFAPQADASPSYGYSIRLYNGDPDLGGVEIPTTDGTTGTGQNKSVGWVFNYASGVLLVSDDYTGITDPTDVWIQGFRYIGSVAGAGEDVDAIHDNVANEIAPLADPVGGLAGDDIFLVEDTSAALIKAKATIWDALKVSDKRFNVLEYGAVGDGVADDGLAIDTAIKAAEAFRDATGCGATVYFPPGAYRVTRAWHTVTPSASGGLGVFNLKESRDIHFRGEFGSSKIILDGAFEPLGGPVGKTVGGRMFDILDASGMITFENLVLDGNNTKGVYAFRGTEVILRRIGQNVSLSAPDGNDLQTLTENAANPFKSDGVTGGYVVIPAGPNAGTWPIYDSPSTSTIRIVNAGGTAEGPSTFDYELFVNEFLTNYWSATDPSKLLPRTETDVLTIQGNRVGVQNFPGDVGRLVPDDTRENGFPQTVRMGSYIGSTLSFYEDPGTPLNGAVGLAIISDDDAEYMAIEYDGDTYQVWGVGAGGAFSVDSNTYPAGVSDRFMGLEYDPDTDIVTFKGSSGGAGTLVTEASVTWTTSKTFRPIIYYRSKDTNATPDSIEIDRVTWSDQPYLPKSDDNHLVEIRSFSGATDNESIDLIRFSKVRFQHSDGDDIRTLGVNATNKLQHLWVDHCEHLDMGRSGVSFQHDVVRAWITYNYFRGGTDQQIDMEPTSQNGTQGLLIHGNKFDGRSRGGLLFTPTGTTGTTLIGPFEGQVTNNEFWGGNVFGLDIGRLLFQGNHFYGEARGRSAIIALDGYLDRCSFKDNYVYQRYANTPISCLVLSTRNNFEPTRFDCTGNEFYQAAQAITVNAKDANLCKFIGNRFEYTNVSFVNSNHLRLDCPTPLATDVENNIIEHNTFIGDVETCVRITGGLGGGYTSISHNHGSGCERVFEHVGANWNTLPLLIGNTVDYSVELLTGVTAWIIGGNIGDVRQLAGTGDPSGVVTGIVGDTFHRKDGSSGNIIYICEGGTVWALAGGGGGTSTTIDATPKTADFTVLANTIYLLDPSGGAFTVTLPAASSFANGDVAGFKFNVASAQAVTLDADGTDLIDGQGDKLMNQPYGAIILKSDGVDKWWIV